VIAANAFLFSKVGVAGLAVGDVGGFKVAADGLLV
jgi:hypothetical protein